MAHYALIARINAGDGKFPFVNTQFSKNHRPIGPSKEQPTTCVLATGASAHLSEFGRDLYAAVAALLNLENGKALPEGISTASTSRHCDRSLATLTFRRPKSTCVLQTGNPTSTGIVSIRLIVSHCLQRENSWS